MANFVAFARTNHFRVTDRQEFDAFCAKWGLKQITRDDDTALVGFMGPDDDCGAFPVSPTETWMEQHDPDTDPGDYDGPSLTDELAALLAEGQVAIGIEVGHLKRCYVTGLAWAINNRGEQRVVDLDAIYDLAKELGPNVTKALY